jgi:hypothetical protein
VNQKWGNHKGIGIALDAPKALSKLLYPESVHFKWPRSVAATSRSRRLA